MPLLRLGDRDPQAPRAQRGCGQDLAFITDFATARAIRRSLKLPAQEPEPLAHGPPHEFELLDQIA
ncbi:MAG: hypothetical protein WBH85_08630 [Thermoanaerobaculia bacterium]